MRHHGRGSPVETAVQRQEEGAVCRSFDPERRRDSHRYVKEKFKIRGVAAIAIAALQYPGVSSSNDWTCWGSCLRYSQAPTRPPMYRPMFAARSLCSGSSMTCTQLRHHRVRHYRVRPFRVHLAAPPHPAHAVCRVLLCAHADRMLVGACNPML